MVASHKISSVYKLLAIAGLLAFAISLVPVASASYLYPDVTNNNSNNNYNNNTNTNTVTINVPQYQPMQQYYPPAPVYYPPAPQPQPVYACSDGSDNDGDGRIDLNDPGCSSSFDNDEFNQVTVVNPAPTVLGTRIIYVTAAPAAQTYVYQPAPITVASAGCVLRIYDLGVFNDVNQNAIVRFSTTCPASGFVRYGLASEWEKTSNFTYPFNSQTTGGVTGFATTHQINLGKLSMNQTYFLRAFATSGNTTVFSAELGFVQLPTGVQMVGGVNTTAPVTSASAYNTLGSFFLNPWFLLFLIIALVIAIILTLRRREIVSTTGPIEINA